MQAPGLESAPLSALEKPGDRIGRYKLLQQIGEGGCGVVDMAEQEEPVRRRVALKVIKLGMDTKSVIADHAWLLARSVDAQLRDGSNAVVFAQAAVATTNRKNPYYLDTLAAAYAKVGQFEMAIAIQKEAVALNTIGWVNPVLEAHLKLFQSGKPCRE